MIAVLLTWVNPDPYNPHRAVPALGDGAGLLPDPATPPFVVIGGIDLSPIVVLLVQVVDMVVVQSL